MAEASLLDVDPVRLEDGAGRPRERRDRAPVGGDREHLARPRAGEVLLRLLHLEVGRQAVLELLAFGVEPLLLEHARGAGRLDALAAGADRAREPPHLELDVLAERQALVA